MEKKKLIPIGSTIIVVLLLVYIYIYMNSITRSMLVGSYTNVNFDYVPVTADIPYSKDILRIFKDGHFSSSYWGEGTYELSHTMKGTKIILRYDYEFGKASFITYVERDFLGSIKIILFRDNNHHYLKLD